jgi:hypothetical protein
LSATISAVWQHFTRTAEDNTRATCHTCKKTHDVHGGDTTSSLKNHLKIKHPDLFKSLEESNQAKSYLPKKRAAENGEPSVDPKQRKLEDSVPATQQALSKAIDGAIVDFLTDSGVTFRVVGLASFDKLMKFANRCINLKHPPTYSRLTKIKSA